MSAHGLVGIVAGARHVERAELVGLELLTAVVAQQEELGAGARGTPEAASPPSPTTSPATPRMPTPALPSVARLWRAALWRAATCPISCPITNANWASFSRYWRRPRFMAVCAGNRPRVRLRRALEREVDGQVRAVGHLVELPDDPVEVGLRGRIGPERAALLPGELGERLLAESGSSSSSERSISSDWPVTGLVAQPAASPPSAAAPIPCRKRRRDAAG